MSIGQRLACFKWHLQVSVASIHSPGRLDGTEGSGDVTSLLEGRGLLLQRRRLLPAEELVKLGLHRQQVFVSRLDRKTHDEGFYRLLVVAKILEGSCGTEVALDKGFVGDDAGLTICCRVLPVREGSVRRRSVAGTANTTEKKKCYLEF